MDKQADGREMEEVGDVHGVGPLGISQALGFCFEQPHCQGSHTLL